MTELEMVNLLTHYLPESMLGIVGVTGLLYLLKIKKESPKSEAPEELLEEIRKMNKNLVGMSKSMDGMSKQFGKWFTESALTRQRIDDIWKRVED